MALSSNTTKLRCLLNLEVDSTSPLKLFLCTTHFEEFDIGSSIISSLGETAGVSSDSFPGCEMFSHTENTQESGINIVYRI